MLERDRAGLVEGHVLGERRLDRHAEGGDATEMPDPGVANRVDQPHEWRERGELRGVRETGQISGGATGTTRLGDVRDENVAKGRRLPRGS